MRKQTCPNGHVYSKTSSCPVCPVCEKERKPEEGLYAKLAAPARRALESKGIETVEQLATYTETEILSLHGIGKTTIPVLKKFLAENGLTFNE